jgi:iron complex transport system substrate-binding protein
MNSLFKQPSRSTLCFGSALFAAFTCALCAAPANVPQRIVCLSPDATEILYAIGAFPRVIAVSDYDTYPPEVAKLPRLGQLHDPNLEKLTALRPDLVVIADSQAPVFEDTLKQLGFRVATMFNNSLDEIYGTMLALGRATGNQSEAAKLVASTREQLAQVARRTANLPKLRVVLVVDRTPGTLRDLYTATDGSYLGQLIDIAGGRVAIAPVPHGYAKLSKEDLLAANPDVILDFEQGPKSRFSGDPLAPWQELPELKAVRLHRIYAVNEDYVPHASQRIVQTAELFAKRIHPELP